MLRKVLRVSEWVVNVGSLALLVYIAFVLVNPHRNAFRPPARRVALKPGQTIPLAGIDWGKSHHTLVFALQTGCHFCAASAPFYTELLKKQQGSSWQAVAVLPQPVDKSMAYMRTEGYSVPVVRQMDLAAIGVSGTPTLLLVDRKGKLAKEWVGQLGASGENEVAQALGIGKVAQDEPRVLLAGIVPANLDASAGGAITPLRASQDASTEQSVGTRTVRTGQSSVDDPVRITRILAGSMDITPGGADPVTGVHYTGWTGKPFNAGGDWMKGLVVLVKNVSKKDIIAGSVEVNIPETPDNSTHHWIAHQTIDLGQIPELALYTRDGRKVKLPPAAPIRVAPGQEMKFVFASHFNSLQDSLQSKGRSVSDVTACWVLMHYFYFADGTRWAPFSGYQKPDPSSPTRYTDITVNAFLNTSSVN